MDRKSVYVNVERIKKRQENSRNIFIITTYKDIYIMKTYLIISEINLNKANKLTKLTPKPTKKKP